MTRGAVAGLALLAIGLVGATPVEAQRHPAGHIDFSFIAADPVGDLALFFDQGFGGQISGAFPLDRSGIVRLRADLGFAIYGLERQHYCFSLPFGCRIQTAVTTTNNYAFGGIGPEIVLVRGPVEPYVFGTVGFAGYFTTSALDDEDGYGEYFETTHMSDFMQAWRAGGGLRVRVAGGRKPVAIDFGVEHHQNGVAEFLTKGDIVDHPDGSITLYPNRSEANLTTFRLGVSIGVRR